MSQDRCMKQKLRSASKILQTNLLELNLLQAKIVIIDLMPYQSTHLLYTIYIENSPICPGKAKHRWILLISIISRGEKWQPPVSYPTSYWLQFPYLCTWTASRWILLRCYFQIELLCPWACTFFIFCPWPQWWVFWFLFPCQCSQAYPRVLWPRCFQLMSLAGVHTTSQLYRFRNLCRSSNECMLLSCFADKCTLFSQIPSIPQQCDQSTLQIFRRSWDLRWGSRAFLMIRWW